VLVGGGFLLAGVPLTWYGRVWRKRGKITLEGTTLALTQARSTKIVETEGGRVFHFKSRGSRTSSQVSDMWLLVDRYGKTQVKLVRRVWGDAALDELERRLALPVEVIDKPIVKNHENSPVVIMVFPHL